MSIWGTKTFTAVALLAGLANAQTVRTNAGFNAHQVERNDDGSSGLEPLGFTINFFGKLRASAFVNNNGNLTFDSALPTYTPFGLARTEREIIAPFFADVDTRAAGSRLVTFGQDVVNGHKAFGANYIQVGYYSNHVDKLNSFQVVLIEREDTGSGNFDIEFNYGQIRWETGDASGGVNGYGGTPATVGWSNGTADPANSFELPGSRLSGQFLDSGPRALVRQSLSGAVQSASGTGGTSGRLIFRARDGVISPGLRISNGTQLPDATLGATYATALAASGSKGPFRWTMVPDVSNPPGLTFSPSGAVTGVPTAAGTYSFTLGVTATTEDGEITVYSRGSLTVRPPVVAIVTGCPLEDATVGRPYSVSLRAGGSTSGYRWSVADPYSLPPGVALSTAGQLAGTPLAPGTFVMTLRAQSAGNDNAQAAQTSCRLNVQPASVRLVTGCSLRATVSVPYSQILSSEGGFGPYRFRMAGNLPVGLAMTESGMIGGTPQVDGVYAFSVQVTDSRGVESTQSCALTVDEAAFSIAEACPLPSGSTGSAYSLSLGGGYTWSVSNGALPTGLTLSPDGTISGTPMTAGIGRFGLLATDSAQKQVGQACTLVVNRGPLSISGCPLPQAGAGERYQAALAALGGTSPYFFTALGTLPEGIELTTDGVLHGTTRESGSFPFTVMVREGSGQTMSQACALSVGRPALRIVSSCPLPEAQLGDSYATRLEAAGGLAPYRFDFGGFLPDGLEGLSDGAIRGAARTLGGRAFAIRVTDSQGQTSSSTCSINVARPAPPEIEIVDLPATVAPATSNLSVTVRLARASTQVVEGTLVLGVQSDAKSEDADANQADPRLRFSNGQLSVGFRFEPGTTRQSFPISSTGTVASTVTVSMASLKTAGADVALLPPARSFRILPSPPVVTSACYRRTAVGIDILLNGLSTTRELERADVGAGGRLFITDISGIASSYYSSADTVRAGGTFSLRLSYEVPLTPDQPVGEVSMNLYNTVGAIQVRPIAACQ